MTCLRRCPPHPFHCNCLVVDFLRRIELSQKQEYHEKDADRIGYNRGETRRDVSESIPLSTTLRRGNRLTLVLLHLRQLLNAAKTGGSLERHGASTTPDPPGSNSDWRRVAIYIDSDVSCDRFMSPEPYPVVLQHCDRSEASASASSPGR